MTTIQILQEVYGSLKRDEQSMNGEIPVDVTINNSKSFKYKSSFLSTADNNGVFENVKIAVPPKYLSNFWRS